MKPLVSIITPCLNGENFVERYFESVLNQTYRNIELIFINDGSTDQTEKIAQSYLSKFEEKGMKLIYIYQDNSGQATALNTGLAIFQGEYLTWPDSDDVLSPDSIEKRVSFLDHNDLYGFVRSYANVVNENNAQKVIGYILKTDNPQSNLFEPLITELIQVCCGCYMVKTKAFLDVNPNRKIYESPTGQNWQMLLPIAYKYECGYIDEPLYTYVVRKNSHSRQGKTTKESILKNISNHEDILKTVVSEMNIPEEKYYYKIIDEKYARKTNENSL